LLLGEIETEIVGLQYHEATAAAGGRVYLEREPANLHDPFAIWWWASHSGQTDGSGVLTQSRDWYPNEQCGKSDEKIWKDLSNP